MLISLIGIILFFSPLVFIIFFHDKKKGFLTCLFLIFFFNSLLSAATLFLRVFNYSLIIFSQIVFLVFCCILLFLKKPAKIYFQFKFSDWLLPLLIFIFFLCLSQVHFNYSGKINFAIDTQPIYHDIKNLNYPYPYYSDEWYSIAFINQYIKTGAYLNANPLDNSQQFLNLEFFSHSFLSEIFLLSRLPPLTNYVFISIVFNAFIGALSYVFLRASNVKKSWSFISSLMLLYIAVGANLPGLWNLMPVNMGIIVFLLGLGFLAVKNFKLALLNSILVFLFYPPLIPFYAVSLLIYFAQKSEKGKLGVFLKYSGLTVLAGVLLFVLLIIFNPGNLFIKKLVSKIIYPSFTFGIIPQYPIFKVIFFPVLGLGLWGAMLVFKKMAWFSWLVAAGLFFWLVYGFIDYRFVIDLQRIIFFTSILITISAGFAMNYIDEYARKFLPRCARFADFWIAAAVAVIFIALAPFYTKDIRWQSFILADSNTGQIFYPKAPANTYLTANDLEIFKDIKNKKFLSIPWKGTVISVSTGNVPVSTKDGTVTLNSSAYQNFLSADCAKKFQISEGVDYIYALSYINCPGFKLLAKSDEGFLLYAREKNAN